MPKGETSTASTADLGPVVVPDLDNTEKIESAYKKGSARDTKPKQLPEGMSGVDMSEMRRLIHLIEMKNGLTRKFTDPRPEPQAKKMALMKESAKLQKEFSQKYGLTFSEANAILKEQDKQKQQKKEREQTQREEKDKIAQIHRVIQDVDIIDGVLINDAPPPLPQQKVDTVIPPVDINAAKLAAQADNTPTPKGFWGKLKNGFKSLFSDQRAYNQFGKMAEGPVQTPVAPELEPIGTIKERLQGAAMMRKQDTKDARAEAKEAKMTARWSKEAKADMNRPGMTDEEEEAMFQPTAIDAVMTAAENALTERKAKKMMAEASKPKTQKKIDARVAKEKAKSDKIVADYEKDFDKHTAKKQKEAQELEDWELDEDSPMKPAGEEYDERLIKGGAVKQFVNKNIDRLSAYQDKLATQSLTSRLDNPTAILRGESKLTREAQALDEKGKKLERDLLLKQFANETADLRKTIESIKIGWFSHLKIGPDGKFKNLPGGNVDMVMNFLIAEKDRLGGKGDVSGANKKVDQLEALEKYEEKLKDLEKTLSEIK